MNKTFWTLYDTPLTYARTKKAPLEDNILWDSLAEAQAYVNNVDQYAYAGMTIAVINDTDPKKNGLYFVESIGTESAEGTLKKVGSNDTLSAANYAKAVELAQTASVGTLIKVEAATGEVGSEGFRAAGFYIVSVAGENPSILFLSTSAGDDMDLDQVITALSDLQASVANKVDVGTFNNYQDTVTTALSGKVNNDTFTTELGKKADNSTVASTYATKQELGDAETTIHGKLDTKVAQVDYDTKVAEIDDAIALKASTEDLNSAKTELEGKINAKVAQADYDAKVSEIEGDIATKAEQSALEGAVSTLEGKINAKVAQADYDVKVKAIDDAIALKASQADLTALSNKVGVAASEGVAATGIYEVIANVETALKADITAIPKFAIVVVDALPETGDDATVYLVKEKENVSDLYTEYIYVNGAWENLGKQTVDLSAYSTTTQMNAAIADALKSYVTNDGLTAVLADYAKTADVNKTLEDYAKTADVNKTLEDYVTNDGLATTLTDYAKTADVNKTLEDYVKSADYTTTINGINEDLGKKLEQSDLVDYAKTADVTKTLEDYAKTEDVNAALAEKADASTLDAYVTGDTFTSTLADYAKTADVTKTLEDYAKTKDVNTELGKKADASALEAYKGVVSAALAEKADASALEAYKGVVSAALAEKADASKLSEYVLTSTFNTAVADINTAIGEKADASKLSEYVLLTSFNGDYASIDEDGVFVINTITKDEIDTLGDLV